MHKLSIKELIKKSSQKKIVDKEQQDLKKALELSKIEHLNEQRKRLEQYATQSQKALEQSKIEHENEQRRRLEQYSTLSQQQWPIVKKRKRIIERDEDDDEEEEDKDWFQTISNRPQQIQLLKQRNDKVKQEKNQVLVDIDDVATFLTKKEPVEDESFDLTSLLHEEEETHNEILLSDSESECSIIDLVEEPTYVQNGNNNIPNVEEEDDGYLSPLEGFTSLKDIANQDQESFDAYHNQFKTSSTTTKTRKTTKKTKTTTTAATKRKKYFNKRYWANKKK